MNMNDNKEYTIPITADEKAYIIDITPNTDIRINNEKIQSFVERIIQKKKLAHSLYISFIILSLCAIAFMVRFSSQINQRSFVENIGVLSMLIICMLFFLSAVSIDTKWSADKLHIIPIKEYEYKDDNTKILCITSCYHFEGKDMETNIYPAKYVRHDLGNGEVPYIDAYTYRTSKYFWMTIHLP